MRLGLWTALSRLWMRLVVKTVLPDRLSPVTASQTVEPDRSGRLIAFASRSDAVTTAGGNQLIFMAIDLGPAGGSGPASSDDRWAQAAVAASGRRRGRSS